MSIDGAKIIDSDLAFDIYNEFMELYDENYSIDDIKEIVGKWESEITDKIDNEIYFTTLGLALWEIGELSDELRLELQNLIDKNSELNIWNDFNEFLSTSREKELNKYLKKIATPKKQPRQRKRYRLIKNLVFSIGDLVALEDTDGEYFLCIVADTFQNKNKFNYGFAFIVGKYNTIPLLAELNNLIVYGVNVPDSYCNKGFILGLEYTYIEHSDLIKLKDKISLIGNINLDKEKYGVRSFNYSDMIEKVIKTKNRIVNDHNKNCNDPVGYELDELKYRNNKT